MPNRKPHERLFDAILFAIVPVIVYTLMSIHWLLDPFYAREKITRRRLPDLARFPSATSRKIAIHAARGGSIVVQLGVAAIQIAIVVSAVWWLEDLVNRLGVEGWQRTGALVLGGLLVWWAIWWIDVVRISMLTDPTRRSLRRRLIRIGLPTCIPCGRNLKGIAGGDCPDCGAISAA